MNSEATAPPSEWPTDPAAYQLLGKIGQGAFASVWKATTKDKRDCAVKVLNLDHVDTNLAEIRLEVQAMRLSSHPNVLTCHTAFVKDRDLWLVTQLMRKGSSLHCLASRRKLGYLPVEPHIIYILHETLLGLQYLHNNGQIHRDVKAGNILLDGNGDVRIADFGVSGWLVQSGSPAAGAASGRTRTSDRPRAATSSPLPTTRRLRSCPGCGTTFPQIRQSGILGCPDCYATFEGLLAPIEYVQIPFSALLGAMFFAEQPGWALLWGTLIMVGATLYLTRSATR